MIVIHPLCHSACLPAGQACPESFFILDSGSTDYIFNGIVRHDKRWNKPFTILAGRIRIFTPMKTIATISNKDFGLKETKDEDELELRNAARAVLFNEKSEMAIIAVPTGNYHKIPGGGVEEGEDTEGALKREILEEVGCEAEIIGEIGQILEFRDPIKQYSYGYIAQVKGEIGQPKFTASEKEADFQLAEWMPIEEAIGIFEEDKPNFLMAKFMSKRDKMFLEKAKEIMEDK